MGCSEWGGSIEFTNIPHSEVLTIQIQKEDASTSSNYKTWNPVGDDISPDNQWRAFPTGWRWRHQQDSHLFNFREYQLPVQCRQNILWGNFIHSAPCVWQHLHHPCICRVNYFPFSIHTTTKERERHIHQTFQSSPIDMPAPQSDIIANFSQPWLWVCFT